MGAAMALSTPEDQVTALIREVAAENALDIEDQLKDLNPASASLAPEPSTSRKEDQLERRSVHCTHQRNFQGPDSI